MPENLGAGEREAIVLAKERHLPLLIDDRTARREAEKQGVACFGFLRVLKEAKDQGIVAEVKPVLDALMRTGLYISDTLSQTFLREMGE